MFLYYLKFYHGAEQDTDFSQPPKKITIQEKLNILISIIDNNTQLLLCKNNFNISYLDIFKMIEYAKNKETKISNTHLIADLQKIINDVIENYFELIPESAQINAIKQIKKTANQTYTEQEINHFIENVEIKDIIYHKYYLTLYKIYQHKGNIEDQTTYEYNQQLKEIIEQDKHNINKIVDIYFQSKSCSHYIQQDDNFSYFIGFILSFLPEQDIKKLKADIINLYKKTQSQQDQIEQMINNIHLFDENIRKIIIPTQYYKKLDEYMQLLKTHFTNEIKNKKNTTTQQTSNTPIPVPTTPTTTSNGTTTTPTNQTPGTNQIPTKNIEQETMLQNTILNILNIKFFSLNLIKSSINYVTYFNLIKKQIDYPSFRDDLVNRFNRLSNDDRKSIIIGAKEIYNRGNTKIKEFLDIFQENNSSYDHNISIPGAILIVSIISIIFQENF